MQRILCNFAIWSNKVVRQPFEAQKRAGTEAWVHLFITELKFKKKKKLSFKGLEFCNLNYELLLVLRHLGSR